MAGEQSGAVESCEYDGCEREVDDGERCYWHKEEDEKCPEEDLELDDGFPVDLTGAYLSEADLSEGVLGSPLLSNRTPADLTDADLSEADLTDAHLFDADLTDADLRGTNLTDANLRHADLTDAALFDADLTDADPRHATFHRTDLREVEITNLTLNRETTITDLPEPSEPSLVEQIVSKLDVIGVESDEPESRPSDWDEVARFYHALKQEFDGNGLVTQARRFHRLERRARRHETRVEEGRFSWAHFKEYASGFVTGYGVGVKRIAGIATLLFAVSTATYALASVENPLTYSAITFATAPPYGVRNLPLYARLVAGVETIFGTLLLITLGFVLSNREQF